MLVLRLVRSKATGALAAAWKRSAERVGHDLHLQQQHRHQVGPKTGMGLSACVASATRSMCKHTGAGAGAAEVNELNEEMEELFGQKLRAMHEPVKWSNGMEQHVDAGEQPTDAGASMRKEPTLTHVDENTGDVHMVNVGTKASTRRKAVASVKVLLDPPVYDLVSRDGFASRKGNVLALAQVAGIQAAKRTWELIPLCHNILIDQVQVDCTLEPETKSVAIVSSVETRGPTGVEMEALTAASVAALTIYDMCKAASKATVITDLALVHKSGGKSGTYQRE